MSEMVCVEQKAKFLYFITLYSSFKWASPLDMDSNPFYKALFGHIFV